MPATRRSSFFISRGSRRGTTGRTRLFPQPIDIPLLDFRTMWFETNNDHPKKSDMRFLRSFVLLAFSALLSVSSAWSAPAPSGEYFVYFGTYTGFTYMLEGLPAGGSHSKGIYVSRFQPATGKVSKPELAAEIVNPAFLAVHPNQRSLSFTTKDP